MDTKESAQPTPSRPARWPAFLLVAVGLACIGGGVAIYSLSGADPAPYAKPKVEPKGLSWSYEEVFPNWPKDRKPEFVLVISGQTYGYLQKCGCSDPQKGGLERRFNFIAGLNKMGIEAVPIDLGDVAPEINSENRLQTEQALLKYVTAMRIMKEMGYKAVGAGKAEFALDMVKIYAEYALQPGNREPGIIMSNLEGILSGAEVIGKDKVFVDEKSAPVMRDWVLTPTKAGPSVGVVSIVGSPVIDDIKKIDKSMIFAATKVTQKLMEDAVGAIGKERKKDKGIDVLLYNGPVKLAPAVSKLLPQFRIIVAMSEEAEPPAAPMLVDPAKPDSPWVIRVGHKGQSLGVVGVFKTEKGFELMYQKVTLTPEFETPDDMEALAKNLALVELEKYSKTVKDRDFLSKNPKMAHPLQVTNPLAAYTGSASCLGCHKDHGDSGKVWQASKHAQAYAALDTIAKRPSLRNFDPECIRCHTVGYDYKTGYVNAALTPQLQNVGCENCHGPGSQHVAMPNNKEKALELSPWKINGKGNLPTAEQMKQYMEERDPAARQKIIGEAEMKVMLNVDRVCQTCHNTENDPHFKIEVYWPKIVHSLKPAAKAP